MKKIVAIWSLILVFLGSAATVCAIPSDVEFRADYYERDMATNSIRGKGNAYYRQGPREFEADEMEVDFNLNRAIARGNVRIKDGALTVRASHVDYSLNGTEASFEDAILVSDKLVVSGKVIEKKSNERYVIIDGTYSNCNLCNPGGIPECEMDWKMSGSKLDVTLEGYAHIYGGVVYVRGIPVMYTPYLILPVKSKRQSGVLIPAIVSQAGLGTGMRLPFYWAIGPWHDLTLTPTLYQGLNKRYHLGINYRYLHSPHKQGYLNYFFSGPSYTSIDNWAADIRNIFYFGERAHTRQMIRLVSTPQYTQYFGDLGGLTAFAALRSQASVTVPFDNQVVSIKAQHFQSLSALKTLDPTTYPTALPIDIDKGAPVVLPALQYSHVSTPLFGRFLTFEFDSAFTNYYRTFAFDEVPETGKTDDLPGGYDGSDFLRTGRRMHLEPRLITTIPMPSGIQLQPLLKAGSLLYHFDYADIGKSNFAHYEYLQAEVPLTFYLSRSFETGIKGFEKIAHVMQPRINYVHNFLRSPTPDHSFFVTTGDATLFNPRFDILDSLAAPHSVRFELINRFLKKSEDTTERFLLVRFSEQYNILENSPGPFEALGELRLGRFSLQFETQFALEPESAHPRNDMPTSDVSVSLNLRGDRADLLRLNTRFLQDTNVNGIDVSDKRIDVTFNKYLFGPLTVGGFAEYSIKNSRMVAYEGRFYLQRQPKSCWMLGLSVGRNAGDRPTDPFRVNLMFDLDFGSPGSLIPL